MSMKRCSNGHFYDDTKYANCPFCEMGGAMNGGAAAGVTMPLSRINQQQNGAAMQGGFQQPVTPTPPPSEKTVEKRNANNTDGKTVGLMRGSMGFDPVVGWLVCINGPDVGKDYRLRSEKNFIGRAANMDVAIQSDNGIARQNHAVVSYNPKKNNFILYPGEGHGLVYLNGDEVYVPTEIKTGDCIELGNSELILVQLCGEGFRWQKD